MNVAVCNSRRWVAVVLCGAALACAPAPARPHTRVRFAIGTPGGSIHALGEALAREWRASFPDLDLEVHERTAAVSNIAAVERGDADVSFAYADVVYTAFAGAQRAGETPADQIRGMALLQIAPVHLVVGRHVTARTIADLAGRQLGLGQPFSSTQLEAESLLNAFGLGGSRVHSAALPFDEAAERLSRGTLDAFFLTASYPAESVTRAMEAGAVLVPLEGPVVESLRRESVFLRPAVIPAGTYPGQRDAVHTVGVHNVLVCRRDLDERLVHELTRRFFEVLPALLAEQPSLRLVDVQQAPATPVPLHPGAARYYRELELAR
jgi:TRAP transporter TAXI family solute receptor